MVACGSRQRHPESAADVHDAEDSHQLAYPLVVRTSGGSYDSSAGLGPHWVRVTAVLHGHQRARTVANGSEEPQVAGPSAQAAGMMRRGDSDCGPEGRGFESPRSPQIISAV